MSDDPEVPEEEEKKGGKKPLLIGLVMALLGGAGGFYAVSSGMILGGEEPEVSEEEMAETSEGDDGGEEQAADDTETAEEHTEIAYASADGVTFVPLEAIVITLPNGASNTHLRFRAQLEVLPGHDEHVRAIAPRVVDVLNGYLRAVEVEELEDRSAFPRLRAQMLRRVQVVAGEGTVQNILIQEFLLN